MKLRRVAISIFVFALTVVGTVLIHNFCLDFSTKGAVKGCYGDVFMLRDGLGAFKDEHGQYPATLTELLDAKDTYVLRTAYDFMFARRLVTYLPITNNERIDSYVLIVEANPSQLNGTFVFVQAPHASSGGWATLDRSIYIRPGRSL